MFSDLIIYTLVLIFCCFLASAYLIPKVSRISSSKGLMDQPNNRSSHLKSTPSLGGIAFYIIFILTLYFTDQFDNLTISKSILPGATLMFFMGLKDDIVGLSPKVKFGGQILACLFILSHPTFDFDNLNGFLGVFIIPIWIGKPLSLLIMITIINAYNLIDGIDGLAASLGTVALTCFAICFFWIENNFLGLTAVSMIGTLLGFLFFNLSERKKIFMGDTGSLLIGFLISLMSIRLLSLDAELNPLPFDQKYIPLLMGIIILLPIYDVIRVFIIRIIEGRPALTADRNHLHHVIIDKLNWSHRRASFALSFLSFLILAISIVIIIGDFGLLSLLIFLSITIFFITWVSIKWSQDIKSGAETLMKTRLLSSKNI